MAEEDWSQMKKFSSACLLHAGKCTLQTQAHNISSTLLFLYKIGYVNETQFHVRLKMALRVYV